MKAKPKTLHTLGGTHDVLLGDVAYWKAVRDAVSQIAEFYGFGLIETPILEYTDLFVRSVGRATDIVEKQMYSFTTKGGDSVTLRPEGTAPIIRSYIEHGMSNLPQPVKFFYLGPMFRYESPQKGRYREFHQFGFEVIGERSPVIEVQIIEIVLHIFEELKLGKGIVQINSMGCPHCRPMYRKLLSTFYKNRAREVCQDCRKRLGVNVLRLLDCKEEKCAITRANAPQIVDSLCEECHNHFKVVLEYLDELTIPYMLNPHLVRGLDYYTRTVFEFLPEEKSSEGGGTSFDGGAQRQVALGGGGRYDELSKLLGGKDTPAVGVACGIERIIHEMKSRHVPLPQIPAPAVFLVQLGELARKKSFLIFEELRKAGVMSAESFGRDTIKSQLKLADKLNVKFALILGQKEALENSIIIREMQSGRQETVSLESFVKEVKRRLKK